jgi:glucan phosphoethanolaminetransferase (alkaline phosphatase superfamily)
MPELKRMLKVIGWGILPFSLCLLVSTRYSNNWYKQFEIMIAGFFASMAVLVWIGICRSDDAADD